MALAATRARLCAAGAAAAKEDGARAVSAAAARAVRGVVNMPSRSIAAVLLRSDAPVANGALFAGAREYGLLKSHRHFKHTLRMMKEQRRVQVIPGPPVRHHVSFFKRRGGLRNLDRVVEMQRRERLTQGFPFASLPSWFVTVFDLGARRGTKAYFPDEADAARSVGLLTVSWRGRSSSGRRGDCSRSWGCCPRGRKCRSGCIVSIVRLRLAVPRVKSTPIAANTFEALATDSAHSFSCQTRRKRMRQSCAKEILRLQRDLGHLYAILLRSVANCS